MRRCEGRLVMWPPIGWIDEVPSACDHQLSVFDACWPVGKR